MENTIVAENLKVGKHYLFFDKFSQKKSYLGAYKEKGIGNHSFYEKYPIYIFEKRTVHHDTPSETLQFEETTEEEQNRLKSESKKVCYEAYVNGDGKYSCPKCNNIEGGTSRIITHIHNCDYNGMNYCKWVDPWKSPPHQKGGKRRTRRRMNKKKTKRKTNKKTRMKRRKTHKKKTNKRRRKR